MYRISLAPLPTLTASYEIERQTVWSCADKQHILVLMLEGACVFTLPGQSVTLRQGQALLLPGGTAYTRSPHGEKPCRFAYLHFTAELRPSRERAENALNVETVTDLSGEEADVRFFLDKALRTATPEDRLIASLALTQLLALMSRRVTAPYHIASQPGMDRFPPPLKLAVEYLRTHYAEKLTLPALSSLAGISPQHLNRLFGQYLSCPAMAYLSRVRLMHATELLRSSNLTIEEIAYVSGFSSPAYFCRLFKKVKGLTPGGERERIAHFKEEKT